MAGMDKVVSDPDKQEKAIQARVRPPLEQTRPLQDSADRLQDMRVMQSSPNVYFLNSAKKAEGTDAFQITKPKTFPCRISLLLSVRSNQRSPLKCRSQRASWFQTQPVPALLNFTARWTKPARSSPTSSSSCRALRRSTCLIFT